MLRASIFSRRQSPCIAAQAEAAYVPGRNSLREVDIAAQAEAAYVPPKQPTEGRRRGRDSLYAAVAREACAARLCSSPAYLVGSPRQLLSSAHPVYSSRLLTSSAHLVG